MHRGACGTRFDRRGAQTMSTTENLESSDDVAARVEKRRKLGRILILIFVAVIIVAEIGTFISRSQTASRDARPAVYRTAQAATGQNRIIVEAKILEISPASGSESIRLTVVPQGSYSDAHGELATPMNLDADGYSGGSITLPAHEVPAPVQINLNMKGDLSQYPVDHYSSTLLVNLRPVIAGVVTRQDVPTVLTINSSQHDWKTSSKEILTRDGAIVVQLNAQRGGASVAFAFFEMLIMALLACIAVAITYAAIVNPKPLEFSLFVWLGAMLFALPAIRGTMPGVPGVGTVADYAVFFWCLIAVASCLITAAITYIRAVMRSSHRHHTS